MEIPGNDRSSTIAAIEKGFGGRRWKYHLFPLRPLRFEVIRTAESEAFFRERYVMAKPNYQFQKRQKELERKKKQEEKLLRKRENDAEEQAEGVNRLPEEAETRT